MTEDQQQVELSGKAKQLAAIAPYQVKKGQVLNPRGKAPGTANRINQETKAILSLALQKNMPEVDKAITQLLRSDNEHTRLRAIELVTKLMEFTTPKLSAMAVKSEGTSGVIVIGKPADLELVEEYNYSNQDNNIIDIETE